MSVSSTDDLMRKSLAILREPSVRTMATYDDLMADDRTALGHEAMTLLSRVRPHLLRQRQAAIDTLINHHRAETLTDGNMRSGIATLAVLDTLEKDLTQRVKVARKDMEERMT